MAGKATYKPEEIYWILRKVFQFRVSDNDLIMTQFQTEFGRELLKTQLRYVKQAYGDSPDYNCPRSTKYPMLPKHENLWNLQKRRVSKKRGVRRESVKSVYDEFVMNAKGPLDPRPEEADPSHERMDMSDYSEREADSGSSQMSEALNRTTPR
ncbi:hypothetical protein LMH87_006072 [Akanthomyces muscarius]|uniref:Uncharacterized protein n=1 Tax=Akanthomyces muscarius TaxID=2231603 RepID=A0A9W8UR61_AKAMU|nr:hypothetical protein LMH87_006072 [Akanthomyces muscarius]KAJ4164396.1 hypothetical protein LMH87_006072 [Akanthomyces muscarius]